VVVPTLVNEPFRPTRKPSTVPEVAFCTYLALIPTTPPLHHLLERHYTRKHGPDAYCGNPEVTTPAPPRS
jgi:L-ribulose-5-phosphate 4-epimerase